jgi:hypothetical protein
MDRVTQRFHIDRVVLLWMPDIACAVGGTAMITVRP